MRQRNTAFLPCAPAENEGVPRNSFSVSQYQLIFLKICVIIELLIHNMGFDSFLAQGMGDGDAVVPVLNVVGIPNL